MKFWPVKSPSLRQSFFLISFSIIFFFSVAVAVTLFMDQQKKMQQSLENKGQVFAQYISTICRDALLLKDTLLLDSLVAEAHHDGDIVYAFIEDTAAAPLTTPLASLDHNNPLVQKSLAKLPPDSSLSTIIADINNNGEITPLSQKIMVGSSFQGTVRMGLSGHNIRQQLIRAIIIILVGMFIMSLALAIALNTAANRLVLRPVYELAHAANRLSTGDLATRITITSVGEIKMLCDSFNQMAAQLSSDITKLRLAEAEIRYAHDSQEAILNALPDLMFRIDKEGIIHEFHTSALNLPPVSTDSIQGKKISEALPAEPARIIMAAMDDAVKHGSHRGAVYSLTMPQGETWFEISIAAMGKTGTNFIMLARDVTKRKHAEKEQSKLQQQLLHTQKLESLGVLAGGIAHDFNNILTAIIGNAELALMRINKESPAVDHLHKIELAATRAADLAKQMLAYSGKGKFIVEQLNLNQLLEEMLHMLEVSISKKVILRLNPSRSTPTVEADATQIRQIVMNLVINASEAIGEKDGVITITSGCLECDTSDLKNIWLDENLPAGIYAYLEVADTGCGMDKQTLSKLFDPFFTTKFTGRGLGMSAVLGIIRGHNGSINVSSELGKGTTFKILLPASNKPAELFNNVKLKEDWQGSGTVLLVDDEEIVRAIGVEMLKELGFTTITANDGREAVEIFKTNPSISFVILDLSMPNMDGKQCFCELQRIRPDIKVIMTSGYHEQEVNRQFVGMGLAGFIQKPFTLSVLKEMINSI